MKNRRFIPLILYVVILIAAFSWLGEMFRTDVNQIPYSEVVELFRQEQVKSFVVEDDSAKYVEITTGLTGSGVTEVTSGLTAGQQLVIVGQSYLKDGAPVRVVSGEDDSTLLEIAQQDAAAQTSQETPDSAASQEGAATGED